MTSISATAQAQVGELIIHWGAVAAAVTAISVLAGGAWMTFRRVVKKLGVKAQEIRGEIVADVEAKVGPPLVKLISEHQPNGGSSTFDKLLSIQHLAQSTDHLVREHITAERLSRANLERRLEQHLEVEHAAASPPDPDGGDGAY